MATATNKQLWSAQMHAFRVPVKTIKAYYSPVTCNNNPTVCIGKGGDEAFTLLIPSLSHNHFEDAVIR